LIGTFDALHAGHWYFLGKAKCLGESLVVFLARDEFVRTFKGKIPKHKEKQRLARLRASGLADCVYLSDPIPGSYDLLLKVKPDLVCLGYDQDSLGESLRSWLESRQMQIQLMKIGFFHPVTVS